MKALKYIFIICLVFTLLDLAAIFHAEYVPVTGFTGLSHAAIASPETSVSLTLEEFVSLVMDGHKDIIRGVYAADTLALHVVQQPSSQPGFVSTLDGVATQFMDAKKYGSIGLLSHNFLSGKLFYQLKIGDVVQLVFGDGTVTKYQVESIQQYQALQPENPRSTFVDLVTGIKYSSTNLFLKIYAEQGRLVLQTCIQNGDELSWGRLFIIAIPVIKY